MKITYTFVDGTTTTIEVDENWGKIILQLDKIEEKNERKETRRHTSLEIGNEYSSWLVAEDEYFTSLFSEPNKQDVLRVAISKLKPEQQKLLKALYFDGCTQEKLAQELGVSQVAIHKKLKRILKKLESFF